MADINTTETTKRVNGDIERTNKDVTKTTTYKPSTEIKQKISMPNYKFIGPDGQRHVDPNALARENDFQQRLRDQHKVDENGKFIGTTGDLFGFNPERYILQEEEKRKLERFKQKEAGWKNALGVVSDIITAGHGGNVWERQPDDVAAKAEEKAVGYEENARKMAAAIPQAIAAREAAYNEARNKHLLDIMQESTVTYKQGGGKTENTVGGGYTQTGGGYTKTTTGTKSGTGVGYGSGKSPKQIVLNGFDKNGKKVTNVYEIPQQTYDMFSKHLETVYNRALEQKDESVAHYLESIMRKDENGETVYDINALVQSGIYLNLPAETQRLLGEIYQGATQVYGAKGDSRLVSGEEQRRLSDAYYGLNVLPGVAGEKKEREKAEKQAPYLN